MDAQSQAAQGNQRRLTVLIQNSVLIQRATLGRHIGFELDGFVGVVLAPRREWPAQRCMGGADVWCGNQARRWSRSTAGAALLSWAFLVFIQLICHALSIVSSGRSSQHSEGPALPSSVSVESPVGLCSAMCRLAAQARLNLLGRGDVGESDHHPVDTVVLCAVRHDAHAEPALV